MRSHRWILLAAAVGAPAVGCSGKLGDGGAPPDTTPSPIASISAPVVGYTGTAEALRATGTFVFSQVAGLGMLFLSTFDFLLDPDLGGDVVLLRHRSRVP